MVYYTTIDVFVGAELVHPIFLVMLNVLGNKEADGQLGNPDVCYGGGSTVW